MDDKQPGWKKFQNLKFSSKDIAKSARKAEATTIRHARKFIARRISNIYDVRRNIAIWMIGIAVLIVTIGLQQAWFRQSYTHTAPVSGGAYAEGILGKVNSLNPLYATTEPEKAMTRLVFSSLLQYDSAGVLGNDAASSYRVEDGGKRVVVTLRPDVRWHDGTLMTVKDVVFTTELMKNKATRSQYESQWSSIDVKQSGDRDIIFTLPAVYSALPHVLTFPILPEHILRDVKPTELRESDFSRSPIGSGPFAFKLSQPDKERHIINLTAFEDYFRGSPRLERFEIHTYTSRGEIKKALHLGEITATGDIETDKDITDKRFDVVQKPLNSGVYAFFNMSQPSVSDVKVRRALNSSLDIIKLRSQTRAKYPLSGPFVAGQVSGVDDLNWQTYDKQAAEKLLDEAGWKLDGEFRKKDNQTLTMSVVTTNDPKIERAARFIADTWKGIGAKVDLNVVDPNDASRDFTQNTIQARAYDVLIHEISIGADPDVYAFWHSSQANSRGLNLSMYKGGLSDDALTSARSRIETPLRDVKYLAFAKQWQRDIPAIGLYQTQMTYIGYPSARSLAKNQQLVSSVDRYSTAIHWTTATGDVYNTP